MCHNFCNCQYFHERGFVPVPDARDAFYRPGDDILALDAHQANLVRTPAGLVPIDIPTFHPEEWPPELPDI